MTDYQEKLSDVEEQDIMKHYLNKQKEEWCWQQDQDEEEEYA